MINWAYSSVVERFVDIEEVISSILITPTKKTFYFLTSKSKKFIIVVFLLKKKEFTKVAQIKEYKISLF